MTNLELISKLQNFPTSDEIQLKIEFKQNGIRIIAVVPISKVYSSAEEELTVIKGEIK